MKNFKKTSFAIGFVMSAVFATSALAQTDAGKRVLERDGSLSKTGTLDLCINYSTLQSDAEKKLYIKELDLRSQLSVPDHNNIDKKVVVTSMTMCGMYMSLGKPLAEQSRQIRPLTFKTVHVYPEMYYVSQSGMIVEAFKREEGSMPPKLAQEAPAVAESPTLKK